MIERYIVFKHDFKNWNGLMGSIFYLLFPFFFSGI
jgi:hypothetical protein